MTNKIYQHNKKGGLIYQKSYLLPLIVEQALIEKEVYENIFNVLKKLKNKGRTLINKLINRK